jgi:hypothetical protein
MDIYSSPGLRALLSALPFLIGALTVPLVGLAYWSRRWPSVKGVVDISIYDTDRSDEYNSKKLFLSYSYTVAGRQYAGDSVVLGGLSQLRSDQANRARYREGVEVNVVYCPLAPGISCLEHGGVFKGIALVLACAVVMWLGIRRMG